MIAPVIINIFAFHLFLAPTGIGVAAALVALTTAVAWHHRDAYRPMLAVRTAPTATEIA